MASKKPVTVTWYDARGVARYKGFNLIAYAQKFAKELSNEDLSCQVWVQGEIFEQHIGKVSTRFEPGNDIPY